MRAARDNGTSPCARRAEDVAPYQITDDIANDPGTEVAPREISSSMGIPEPNGPQLSNDTVDLNAGRVRRPRRPATTERPHARGAPRTSRPTKSQTTSQTTRVRKLFRVKSLFVPERFFAPERSKIE